MSKPRTDTAATGPAQVRRALAALHEYVSRQPAPAGDAGPARERFLAESAPFAAAEKAEG